MNHEATTLSINAGFRSGDSKRAFARHFGEMVLAMVLGMVILGGLAELLLAAAGSSLSDQSGSTQVMLMGLNMTVPMVLWMSYRGHAAARSAEMALSMIVPSVAAAALAWAGALESGAALGVQHAVMIPAMLGVMLWRYQDYSHPTRRVSIRSPLGPALAREE
jgi:uncharacterized membrane protein YhaH (DUF805 family)